MSGYNYMIEYCTDKNRIKTKYYRNAVEARNKFKELSKQNNLVDGELFFKGRSIKHFIKGV